MSGLACFWWEMLWLVQNININDDWIGSSVWYISDIYVQTLLTRKQHSTRMQSTNYADRGHPHSFMYFATYYKKCQQMKPRSLAGLAIEAFSKNLFSFCNTVPVWIASGWEFTQSGRAKPKKKDSPNMNWFRGLFILTDSRLLMPTATIIPGEGGMQQ